MTPKFKPEQSSGASGVSAKPRFKAGDLLQYVPHPGDSNSHYGNIILIVEAINCPRNIIVYRFVVEETSCHGARCIIEDSYEKIA